MIFKTVVTEISFKTLSMRNRRREQAGVGAVSNAHYISIVN